MIIIDFCLMLTSKTHMENAPEWPMMLEQRKETFKTKKKVLLGANTNLFNCHVVNREAVSHYASILHKTDAAFQ